MWSLPSVDLVSSFPLPSVFLTLGWAVLALFYAAAHCAAWFFYFYALVAFCLSLKCVLVSKPFGVPENLLCYESQTRYFCPSRKPETLCACPLISRVTLACPGI